MSIRTPLQEVVLDILADSEIDVESQKLDLSYRNLVRLIKLADLGDIEHAYVLIETEGMTDEERAEFVRKRQAAEHG